MVSLNGGTVSHFVNRDRNPAIISQAVPTYMGVHVRTGRVRFRNIRVMAL
jgi:hypothetical protein